MKDRAKNYIIMMLSGKLPLETFARVEVPQGTIYSRLMKSMQELMYIEMPLNAENLYLISKDAEFSAAYMSLVIEEELNAYYRSKLPVES